MERGTDREREALRERWAAMERERELADRLVSGVALVGIGCLLLLLSVPARTCDHGDGVAGTVCSTVSSPAGVETALVVLGVVGLTGGAWLCWRAVEGRKWFQGGAFGLG